MVRKTMGSDDYDDPVGISSSLFHRYAAEKVGIQATTAKGITFYLSEWFKNY